jgi:Domain of unknown function (DUF4956)
MQLPELMQVPESSPAEPIFNSLKYVDVLVEMLIALSLGAVIVGVYRFVRRNQQVDHTFPVTLVLLTVLISIVTKVIGSDVARAFSLVGALSIVRFRTVVEDTLDIGFVIFVVVVGMAVGSGQWQLALMGTGVVGIAAAVMHEASFKLFAPKESQSFATLRIRLTIGSEPMRRLDESLRSTFERVTIVSTETSRGGSAIDIQYRVHTNQTIDPIQIANQISSIEGVQSVLFETETNSKKS